MPQCIIIIIITTTTIIIIVVVVVVIIIIIVIPVLSQSVPNVNGRIACTYACKLAVNFCLTFKTKIGINWHIVA